MTKLSVSWTRRAEHGDGPLQLMWTILCWAAAFSAVVVTTAVLMH